VISLQKAASRTEMAKPLRLVKRADGTILRLGDGSDYIAIESLTVSPLVQVQVPPVVTPAILAASIRVAS
jgi:hypothetical protein